MQTDHTQAHSFVRVDQVAEVLAGGGDRDSFPVPELVQSTLDTEVSFPILAIGCRARRTRRQQQRRGPEDDLRELTCTTSHCAQQVRIDLDNLLDSAGSCVTWRARRKRDSARGEWQGSSATGLTDVAALCGARIDGNNDTTFEAESERRRAVLDFDLARRVRCVVRVQLQERRGLAGEVRSQSWCVYSTHGPWQQLTSCSVGIANSGIGIFSTPRPSGNA